MNRTKSTLLNTAFGICVSGILILLFSGSVVAQPPSPSSVLGFAPADDRKIADWPQITDYFGRLDRSSSRVLVKEFGRSTLGRPIIAAFISSSDNIRDLEKYRRISARLADPRTIKDAAEADALIKNGKTIISISCSIHSTEIVASQMSMQLAYELATADDVETRQILENTILILIPSPNPDGIDIVADWYRKTLGTKSEGTSPPELYHHYAGHDNNRDWFMMNLEETRAVTKLYWQEWFPQIVYDVHQMGTNGARFVIPPFFDPPNPRIPPLIIREVGLVGYKMAADLQSRNIAGVATNTTFDTWWHGGFRSAPYYHNSIGILSEAASAQLATPLQIKREILERSRPARGLASPLVSATNLPDPWPGGIWRPRDIAEIELVASRALLTMAAKYRERYLRNFFDLNKKAALPDGEPGDPIAFLVPAGQPQAAAVSRFLEILMWQGIEVHEMKKELMVTLAGESRETEMPLGSFLIFVNQPQRSNVLSLFERQAYPHLVDSNGQPDTPYDVAGWTLPLQMGIEYLAVQNIHYHAGDAESLKRSANIGQIRQVLDLPPAAKPFEKLSYPLRTSPRIGLYRPFTSSMSEGWTRFVFDTHQIPYRSLSNEDLQLGSPAVDSIILPADGENSIVNGLNANRYPDRFAGDIGEAGLRNLRKFVENGGTLICLDDSCGLVIKHFGLPIKNVLEGIRRSEFYNPGSIVKLNVDTGHRLGRAMFRETAAYFINSSAFEVSDPASVKTIASYAEKDALMSGWMLGEHLINGKTAVAEASFGKGRIILFAFQPQHRGQTWATFPLLFNALEKAE